MTADDLRRTCSAATRAKMSESQKRTWADPETRKRRSEAMRRALADPEVRARISAKRNPHIAALTPAERADYDALRKKTKCSASEALVLIGRKDLEL